MNIPDEVAQALTALPMLLEKQRTELALGLQTFHNGLRLQGARPVQVGTGGRALAQAGAGRLVGWSLRAVAGAVSVTLRDSRDESGDVLAVVELPAGTSASQWAGPGGVSFGEGVRVVATGAGTLEGTLWIGAVD